MENNDDIEMDDQTEKGKEKANENNQSKPQTLSTQSLEGGKPPYSLYTRRIIDVSDISKFFSENSSHGLCGSHNLGNTCFMNSSIACLSNCTELTYYFLSGEYKKDINRENKLGMGGALAESWAELLREYWIGQHHAGDPSDFKRTFGHKIKRFSGYNQQDSNEFIDLFLDNLNEDLNAVTNKQYIELKEKGTNETDEQCSKRFWDNYLKRNDSIITDLFCGQMKSTVTCPNCKFINITFDPFNTLNLNIPESSQNRRYHYSIDNINIMIFYVPKYNLRTPVKVKTYDIPKKAKFRDWVRCLKHEINFKYYGKINKMIANKIDEKQSLEIFDEKDERTLKDMDDDKFYFCYDIMNEKENKYIPIYFKDKNIISEYPRQIMVSENETNMDNFREKIYFNLRKLILSPFKEHNEEIDELSQKIFQYTKDTDIEDDIIFKLIDKEYQILFNSKENPIKNYDEKVNNFLEDIPFQLYLTKDINFKDSGRINIINNKNFFDLSPEFIELTKIKSYDAPIKNLLTLLEEKDYFIVLEFNRESKYINQQLFKLNNCIGYKLNYIEIPEKEEQNQEEDTGIITLKKCFKLFSSEEKLKEDDAWYCPKCKKHVLANKKMELYYTPKILIICFKRFTKHYTYWEKNDENILFPINNLDLKEFIVGPDKDHSVYDLFAVSQHYGGTGFGHYTAVCKNFGNWYSYNDSSVHSISTSDIVSSAAYVLFYRRKTD